MTREFDLQQMSRRSALRTIGAGFLFGAASVPASARTNTLASQLNDVRAATRQYKDVAVARSDGYGPITPYVPNMGFHFAKSGADPDTGLPLMFGDDREDPGVLVYYANDDYEPAPGTFHDPAHDDDLILGAVEYLVPGDQTDPTPEIFDDEGVSRRLKVTEEEGWHHHPPEGGAPEFTALHAWVHRGNPAGVFHGANPTIDGNDSHHHDHEH